MKKKIIIIVAIVLALGAGFFAYKFLFTKEDKHKSYAEGSVEAEAEKLIKNWFQAMNDKDLDRYIECCFTEDLLAYYADNYGITVEDYKSYLAFTLEAGECETKDLEILEKTELSEESFEEINIAMEKRSGKSKYVSHMYQIKFKYKINFDNEWTETEETRKVILVDGKCYMYEE